MAVIALASASGSPGVTTTALGLALLWPRPVLLVEADPTGGSGLLAGYFRGTREYDGGLIELALTASNLSDALADVARPIEGTTVSFVAGTRSHTQASALRDLWAPLAETLGELESTGQDVIVDAGRLGLHGSPEPLLDAADLTLLVSRHDAAPPLGAALVGRGVPAPRTRLAPVGRPAHRRGSALQRPRRHRSGEPARARVAARRSGVGCGVLARSPAAEAVRDRAAGPGAHCGHRLDPLDDHPPSQRAARRSPVMTTERSEDYETTPLAGLPLFTPASSAGG